MAGQRQDGLPIADASALLGLSREALRKRLTRGTLNGYKQDGTWFVVLPPDAPRQDGMAGRQDNVSGRQDAEPIEARHGATPAEVERAIEATAGRYVADFASLYHRIAGEVGALYEAQIAAKDQALAAKDETIAAQRELVDQQGELIAVARDELAALRRRAEAGEAERDALRREVAPSPPPEAAMPSADAVHAGSGPPEGVWARLRRVFGGG